MARVRKDCHETCATSRQALLPLYHGQRDGARRLELCTGIREKALEHLIAKE